MDKEKNNKKFGKHLSDSEIKDLLKNDPKGYNLDMRFMIKDKSDS